MRFGQCLRSLAEKLIGKSIPIERRGQNKLEAKMEVGHVAERFVLNGKMVALIVGVFFDEVATHRDQLLVKLTLFVFWTVPNAMNQPFLCAVHPIDCDFVEKVVVEGHLSDVSL